MANSYFKFKQFVVHQDKAAMKVGTDGVLLGAWVNVGNAVNFLDVGTGTGLIALMLAQRNSNACVTAIDIDKDAVSQASDNFAFSDWTERLKIVHNPLQEFAENNMEKFDHVVCNPPFFNNAYKSVNHSRNLARHTESLSFEDLIANAGRVSNSHGKLSVVLPFDAERVFIEIAEKYSYTPSRITRVRPTPHKDYVRTLIELSKDAADGIVTNEIVIEDKGRHGYSDDYIALTKTFYLKM
ncbi:tRNA1(Val) (adenine(37)-N6)-methyltransferase [Carboxylicivirga sp. RSCT41]|uniref:tRNA1(Val) (adenine(37)-N6)-methyltransferase n=1 Tax=Carboxylicivirga agarovorans TaxID=3417570 RepID=UPI003D33B36E